MARKKKHPEHVNHERWLISYADFITLLFAFFVVMFAVSQVDSKKVGRFTESFSKAVGVDMFPQPGRGLMAGVSEGSIVEEVDPTKGSPLPEELANLQITLAAGATSDEALQGVQVIAKRNELVLRLSDTVLFESGNDELGKHAQLVIAHIANELKNRPVDVRVEGHTDDRPIKTARFRSNWDLSTARAASVVSRLAHEGMNPAHLSAAGYGEFHPLVPNGADDGRKQNRRVDLVVSIPLKEEPIPAPAPSSSASPSLTAAASSGSAMPLAPASGAPSASASAAAPTHGSHESHDSHASPSHH